MHAFSRTDLLLSSFLFYFISSLISLRIMMIIRIAAEIFLLLNIPSARRSPSLHPFTHGLSDWHLGASHLFSISRWSSSSSEVIPFSLESNFSWNSIHLNPSNPSSSFTFFFSIKLCTEGKADPSPGSKRYTFDPSRVSHFSCLILPHKISISLFGPLVSPLPSASLYKTCPALLITTGSNRSL